MPQPDANTVVDRVTTNITRNMAEYTPTSGINDRAFWDDLRVLLENHADSELLLPVHLVRDVLGRTVPRQLAGAGD